jgi:hypothetical protein
MIYKYATFQKKLELGRQLFQGSKDGYVTQIPDLQVLLKSAYQIATL